MPMSHVTGPGFHSQLWLLTLALLMHTLRGASDGPSGWIPAICVGNLD